MRIASIVGARPQFIKAAVMSKALRGSGELAETIIHTGQHFDDNMSQVFFDQLGIPTPEYNLNISGGTHAQMTGRMMIGLEEKLSEIQPDAVLLFGDTNSTLAGVLAAAKLYIPICHAEAGARTHSMTNPEEINRICVDHVSSSDCAPTMACYENLVKEGLGDKSAFTGDLMYDAYKTYLPIASSSTPKLLSLDGKDVDCPDSFYYMTCHREENSSPDTLLQIFEACESLDAPVVYPVHPRMKGMVQELLDSHGFSNTVTVQPVDYFTSIYLTSKANAVVTDSGGLQREAFFAEKKCITLLPFPSADELMVDGRDELVSPVTKDGILQALSIPQVIDKDYMPFGDGEAAKKIVLEIIRMMEEC